MELLAERHWISHEHTGRASVILDSLNDHSDCSTDE